MIDLKTNLYPPSHTTFRHGDFVHKRSGSQWHGRICGWYSTNNNPEGYVVESVYEPGSAQLFPARALELKGDTPWDRFPWPAPPNNTPPKGLPTFCPQCGHKFFCREEHHPLDRPIAVVDPVLDRQVAWECPKCQKEWPKSTSTL